MWRQVVTPLLCPLFLLFCQSAAAQKLVEMEEVEVNSTHRLKDTGLQQTVLDTTVLHQNVSQSLADILTKHTTLFIKSYGRATESTAEFRGTSPSHTQVTWSGMKINSPMLGTVDLSYIPGYFVDEVTLLHGASSLTAVGGGLGGAIEMRTRPITTEGWGLQYVQGIGSFSTYDQFLRLNYANKHWSSSTRLMYSSSKNNFRYTNYDKMVDLRDEEGNIISSYHPKERNKSGYFHDVNAMQDLHYNDGRGNTVSAAIWYSYSLRGLPFLSVDYKDVNDFTNEHQQNSLNSALSWSHTGSNWSSELKAGYTFQDIAYDYFTTREEVNTDITHSRSKANTGFMQAGADYMPRENWLLTATLAMYYNHVRSWDRSPFHIGDNFNLGRMEYNLSLSAKWRPVERLSLSAILREEVYKRDFVPLVPAIFADYVLYKPWNLKLKASIARNYRYPTMSDLYFQPGGNPDLQPERGFSYDGGVEMQIRKPRYSLHINASAFDSHITDWILWTPNAKGYWQPSNVKKVHNYGLEAEAEAEIMMGKEWSLLLRGNYAYTPSINKGRKTNSNDASYGKQLCYVPKTSANVSATLKWRSWSVAYTWTHYSERYTTTSNEPDYITGRLKPYYMSDVTLEKQFQWRVLHASIKGAINNLLNTEYVTVLSHPMAGRNFEILVELTPQWGRK
ncbi:MAG: TonB-dependent receptor [Prevotellaceae bacterium]|nr:TonB-dependent receptor [Prevotellaceae bacterium]